MTPCQNFQRHSSANLILDFNIGVQNGRSSTDAHTSGPYGSLSWSILYQCLNYKWAKTHSISFCWTQWLLNVFCFPALIEETKKFLAVTDSDLNPEPSSLGSTDIESQDLYSDQTQDTSAVAEDEADSPHSLQTLDLQSSSATMNPCSLDEDASLLLAIQLSMERNQRSDTEDLQKALELSKSDSMPNEDNKQLERAFEMSLQDAIKSSNTAEIFVYANYNHDLVRVDIALGKKVGMRQCEEKVESKNLRKLSSHQKRCIELIKRKHAVEISIQGTTAILSGFKDYVSEAVIDLKHVLRRTEKMMNDAEILKAVQWVWYEQGSSKSIPYPPDATVLIENAWMMKQKQIDILFNNQPFSIDFEKMEEHSLASGKSVPIKRKMLSTQDLYTEAAGTNCINLMKSPKKKILYAEVWSPVQ